MLLALLLLAHAQAEWVEITQHKPSRTHFTKTTETNEPKRKVFPFTEPENRYINHSLQHWSKGEPLRTHFTKFTTEANELPKRRVFPSTEPARTDNRVYINHSLEKKWSKGVVHRVPNVGNVKKIQLTTEEPARSKYEETDLTDLSIGYTMRNPFKAIEERIPEFVTKEEIFEDDDIEEVHFERKPPNKPNTPVRRIYFTTETESHTYRPGDKKHQAHNNKEENIENDDIDEVSFERPAKETWTERNEVKVKSTHKPNTPVRRIDFLTDTESETHRLKDNKLHAHNNENENIKDDEIEEVHFVRKPPNKPNTPVRRIYFTTETQSHTYRPDDKKPQAHNNEEENIENDDIDEVSFERPAKETWTERNEAKVKSTHKPNTPVRRIDFSTDTESKVHRLNDNKPHALNNKEENIENDYIEEVRFERPAKETWTERNEAKVKSTHKPNTPVKKVDFSTDTESKTGKPHDSKPQAHNDKNENGENFTENDAKVNTMDNVLKFVKVVADTITKNTRRSFSSKLRYLEDLKDTIMINIEDRIEALYPDDAGPGARRRRGARSAEARGHVEFPSSEGALMTISFLTFAVYLIKLVLQVIQTYKNKTMMVTPAVVAAVERAASDLKPSK